MKFRTKIWMLPVCAGAVFLVGLLISFWSGARTSADLSYLRTVDSPYLEQLLNADRQIEQFRLSLQSAAAEGDASKLSEVEAVVAATQKSLQTLGKIEGKQSPIKPRRWGRRAPCCRKATWVTRSPACKVLRLRLPS